MSDVFKIKPGEPASSETKTIRFKPELYDKIEALAAKSNVSFNRIVNQCIEYALAHMEE